MAMLKIGESAVDVLTHLVHEHADIAALRCVEYGRVSCSEACGEGKRIPPSQDLTARRLRHSVRNRKWHRLQGSDATRDRLLERIAKLPKNSALAVTSRITLSDHTRRHIPMIDFRCDPETTSSQRITKWLQEIDHCGGVILRTTNSFHYYGNSLLTDRQWVKFVGHCLLLVPDVDVRYLGHRLTEGWGALRISPDPYSGTSRNEPEIVEIVKPKQTNKPPDNEPTYRSDR